MEETTYAIIPAGGAGRRMAAALPKQYLPLGRVSILARTLRVFEGSGAIDAVILVVPSADVPRVQEGCLAEGGFPKLLSVVPGGPRRQDSVRQGLEVLSSQDRGIVVIHDAVRPLVSPLLIGRVVRAAKRHGAATSGIPVKETIKAVDSRRRVRKTIDRTGLWLTQTPQAFRLDILREAHRRAHSEGYEGTDDAMLVERTGIFVRMIRGEERNLKITTTADLDLAEALISRPGSSRRERPS